MSWIRLERAHRFLRKLPIWAPVTAGLSSLGDAFLGSNAVPPVARDGSERPLDGFMQRCPDGFRAGAAAVDITPARPEGMYLAGFGFDRRCIGVRDPLFARALVMTDGTTPLVIVTLDLIGLSRPRTWRIRRLLTERYPDSILLVCTHNHQSPDTLGLWGRALFDLVHYRTGMDWSYMGQVERGVIEAVQRAVQNARPARLHLAAGEFDSAGRWVRNERSAVIDRQLRVMQLNDDQDRSIATLVQYACHPATLRRGNRLISADFCSVCCRGLEERLGGVGLYANGALGAMVSAAVSHEMPVARREWLMDRLGEELGRTAAGLASRALKRPVDDPRVHLARSEVCLPAEDNQHYRFVHALRVVEQRDLRRGLVSEVSFARIGPASLTGLPGEAAPALGLEILERVPGEPKFLFCLSNDELGYLLPPEFFYDPSYAYEQSMNPSPDAAVRLALAIERLADRLGCSKNQGGR